jgi:hypothetical protein
MNSQDMILASLPETQLTLGGLLQWLHTQGRLGPLVREALAAPRGLALVVIEQRQPAELDGATRQRIQDELFGGWLAGRLREVALNLSPAGVS